MSGTPYGPKRVICFTDQSDDETLGPWIPVRGASNVSFYLNSTGTTSSGVIMIETTTQITSEPDAPVFGVTTGGYPSITTINASDVSGGLQKFVALPPNVAYGFVRGRISTAIGGGGTVTLVCEVS